MSERKLKVSKGRWKILWFIFLFGDLIIAFCGGYISSTLSQGGFEGVIYGILAIAVIITVFLTSYVMMKLGTPEIFEPGK